MLQLTKVDVALTALALAICLYLWTTNKARKRALLPPGPSGWPIIGNMLDMPEQDQSAQFTRLSKEYNSGIIHLEILGTNLMIVNDLDIILDLLEKRSSIYSSRADLPMLNDLMGWSWAMPMMAYGKTWRNHRRLFQRAFEGRANRQHQPHQIKANYALLLRLLDSPEDWYEHLRYQGGASIMSMAYGISVLPHNDPYIAVAEKALASVAIAAMPGAFLVDTFPLLRYVPAWFPGAGFHVKAREWKKISSELLNAPFDAVKSAIVSPTHYQASDTAAPSFTLRALQGMDATRDIDAQETVIKNTAATIYAGGADTTSSSTGTFILAMTLNPDVQARAQAELDSVLGKGQLPRFGDEPSLPYLMAIVKECLRWRPPLPLAIPHVLEQDDFYRGFYLPKDSLILTNSVGILNDEKYYPDPLVFKPERFLKDGKLDRDVLDSEIAAFGYGRRICPGKETAKASLWLTAGTILATFNIRKAVDSAGKVIEPSGEYEPGMISHPKPFECDIRPRSKEIAQIIRDLASST